MSYITLEEIYIKLDWSGKNDIVNLGFRYLSFMGNYDAEKGLCALFGLVIIYSKKLEEDGFTITGGLHPGMMLEIGSRDGAFQYLEKRGVSKPLQNGLSLKHLIYKDFPSEIYDPYTGYKG